MRGGALAFSKAEGSTRTRNTNLTFEAKGKRRRKLTLWRALGADAWRWAGTHTYACRLSFDGVAGRTRAHASPQAVAPSYTRTDGMRMRSRCGGGEGEGQTSSLLRPSEGRQQKRVERPRKRMRGVAQLIMTLELGRWVQKGGGEGAVMNGKPFSMAPHGVDGHTKKRKEENDHERRNVRGSEGEREGRRITTETHARTVSHENGQEEM